MPMARSPLPQALAALLVCLAVMPAMAQDEPAPPVDPLDYSGPPRKQDEVYLISTRALGEPKVDAGSALVVRRWNTPGKWSPLTMDALLDDDAGDARTLIFVHGYDFGEEKSRRVGWAFYHALCDESPPQVRVRYIIWSWPTEAKRFRPARDFADKARRADADAFYLAQFLTRLPADEPLHVVSSSLGCRVVQGALHLLGGGELAGRSLAKHARKARPRVCAAYISACVHHAWVYDGGFHDKAIARAERLLLVNNSIDSTLLRYSKVWQDNPQALGLDGVKYVAKFGDSAKSIQQYDASEEIGDNHGVEHYLRPPSITNRLRTFCFE